MRPLDHQSFTRRYGRRPLFGMVHLRPLPGSPLAGPLQSVIDAACRDAEAIQEGGAAGLVIENFGDRPFSQHTGAATVALMTRLVAEVRRCSDLPIGVNVLRNDGLSALVIAAATGAAFIRINVLVGAMLTDQGIIEGEAATILREREHLCPGVDIFADHMVKHAAPLAPYDEVQLAKDLRHRGLADAVLVTGAETGSAADPSRLILLRETLPDTPILGASGASEQNIASFAAADGIIAGSSIKRDGKLEQPVDAERVRRLVDAFSKS